MGPETRWTLGLGVGIPGIVGASKFSTKWGTRSSQPSSDDNKKYLTTDLLREERANSDYLTPEIELISYEAIKRVCYTCFDGED
jgi:cysteine synthase A